MAPKLADITKKAGISMNAQRAEEIERLEAQADIRERQADEGEAGAPVYFRAGGAGYYRALERAEKNRKESRELRAQAAQLRHNNR